jgi:hypothetical protein
LGTQNPNGDGYEMSFAPMMGMGMGMVMGCYNPVGNSPLTSLVLILDLTVGKVESRGYRG